MKKSQDFQEIGRNPQSIFTPMQYADNRQHASGSLTCIVCDRSVHFDFVLRLVVFAIGLFHQQSYLSKEDMTTLVVLFVIKITKRSVFVH